MSEHKVRLQWDLQGNDFSYEEFSRTHTVTLENGKTFTCSAHQNYYGEASLINPEDALVMAAASCHMLSFLAIAAKKKWKVLRIPR